MMNDLADKEKRLWLEEERLKKEKDLFQWEIQLNKEKEAQEQDWRIRERILLEREMELERQWICDLER